MIQEFALNPDEILFLKGENGEVGVIKYGKSGTIFIGTPEKDEIALFLEPDDLIAVSAIKTNEKVEEGIKSLILLLRDHGSPLIVLPPDHPTSSRLSMVASCGEMIRLDCNINPGTHPKQDVLCASNDLSGLQIKSISGGVEIKGTLKGYRIEKF
jgi:hypothetical protein